MLMDYIPTRGDIILVEQVPDLQRGAGLVFVLSGKLFNQRGTVIVCPISQEPGTTNRTFGTIVSLSGTGTRTSGAIHCHELITLNWQNRSVRYEETALQPLINEVQARVEAILFD